MTACILVNGSEKGQEGYEDVVIERQQEKFDNTVKEYLSGQIYDADKNILGTSQYSHTKLFAWIYGTEIKIAEEILKKREGSISILDLGTSLGNSLFTKVNFLKSSRVHFWGIDNQKHLIDASERYVKRNHLKNIWFFQENLSRPQWRGRLLETNQGQVFDVVTASHLLEHFPAEDSEKMIQQWLEMTKESLVLSVPFEDK